jgi:hypothetical protein
MGAFTKRWLIRKRRTRRRKIDLLRRRYVATDSEAQRSAIVKKAQLVSPQMSVEEFLGPIQKENSSGQKPHGSKSRPTG